MSAMESLRRLLRTRQQSREQQLAALVDRVLDGPTIDEDKLAVLVDEIGVGPAEFEEAVDRITEERRREAARAQRQGLLDELPRLKVEQRALAAERAEYAKRLVEHDLAMKREAEDLASREKQLHARFARVEAAKNNLLRDDF